MTCDCGHVFCFKCGGDAHAPVTCDLMEKWIKKRRVEYASLVDCKDLIALNVKVSGFKKNIMPFYLEN